MAVGSVRSRLLVLLAGALFACTGAPPASPPPGAALRVVGSCNGQPPPGFVCCLNGVSAPAYCVDGTLFCEELFPSLVPIEECRPPGAGVRSDGGGPTGYDATFYEAPPDDVQVPAYEAAVPMDPEF